MWVDSAWLLENLDRVSVLDATVAKPGDTLQPLQAYHQGHIPGALFFDIEALSDPETDLPHMLDVNETRINRKLSELGLQKEKPIVLYDQYGLWSAPRAWWMLTTYGHPTVYILEGGLPHWPGSLSQHAECPEQSLYTVTIQPHATVTASAIKQNRDDSAARRFQIVDCRSSERFLGQVDEPRSGLQRGHIPGSVNLPWPQFVDEATSTLRTKAELQQLFIEAGLDLDRPIVASCGSGMTACFALIALASLDVQQGLLYDASWAEWGRL
jgi:thiosulfate/3-mercaptopyruvate sulfurtransferase